MPSSESARRAWKHPCTAARRLSGSPEAQAAVEDEIGVMEFATETVDQAEFRDGQRKQWDEAAAGWRKWSPLIDAATQPVSDRLVELARIDSGDHVLDVAAGYGEPSLTAARRVGPSGRVVATDISAEMLAFGRLRAAAAGIRTIEFVERAAASLEFPPGSFDAALSRWGIIFEPDAEIAAARIRAFLKPGARMAIVSWATPDRVPMLGLPMKTVLEQLQAPPPPPDTPGPFARPTQEALGGLLEAAGFSDVDVEDLEVTLEWRSADEFTTFVKDIAPPITALLAPHPRPVQDGAWARIAAAARAVATDSGAVRFRNRALVATAAA